MPIKLPPDDELRFMETAAVNRHFATIVGIPQIKARAYLAGKKRPASVGGLYARPAVKPQSPRPQSVRRFPRGR